MTLRENGMAHYDESLIIDQTHGASSQDDLLILAFDDKKLNGQAIRTLRENLDMSRKNFAQQLGVSFKTVEAWESDKNIPCGVARKVLLAAIDNPEIIDTLAKY